MLEFASIILLMLTTAMIGAVVVISRLFRSNWKK